MPNIFVERIKSKPLYVRIRSEEVDPENVSEFTGKIKDMTDSELFPVNDDLISDTELELLLRMNSLKRLYLEQEAVEINQLHNPETEADIEVYYNFVLELTKCIEQYGERFVNDVLDPLGFRQHHYLLTRRTR